MAVKPAKKTAAKKKTAVPAKKKSATKKKTATKEVATKKKVATKVATKKKTATKVAPAEPKKTKKTPAKRKTASATTPAMEQPENDKGPSTERSPTSTPPATPSERALAAAAERPTERSLTDEEREAMAKVCETARRFVNATGEPPAIVATIATFLDEVRYGKREEPKSQDVRIGLGVLWGEQLRAQVGWRWVHLTYANGFMSYALVPDDRAFACFPLNRVPEALSPNGSNTSAHVFESIRESSLPMRKAHAYLVIG